MATTRNMLTLSIGLACAACNSSSIDNEIFSTSSNTVTIVSGDGKEITLSYVLDEEPKTIQDIEKLFKAFQLEKYFNTIKPLIRSKIDLNLIPTDESKFETAKSKIGGKPHLTRKQKWPKNELGKSLSFIGQLNLQDVSKYDQSGLLPKQGLLSFFYCADQEAWGLDPKDKQRFKVIYTESVDETVKNDFPADQNKHSIFKPNQVTFNSNLSIPTWQEDSVYGVIEEQDLDNYMEVSNGSDNQIFGYANCVQGTMELDCQLVTNGLSYDDSTGYKYQMRKELEKEKNEWILLLQLGSDEEKTGMYWGNGGRIYFWIKRKDLANKNFDNVWCILQH